MKQERILYSSLANLAGFSLLEVLITIAVLSISLLGIAGLQLAGMRYAHQANLRYLASLQANDMAERMSANRAGVSAGAYNNISGKGSNPGCGSSNCTPTQMAQLDAFEWNDENARLLPSGTGRVSGAGANSVFTITVSWTELGVAGTAPSSHSFVVNTQP